MSIGRHQPRTSFTLYRCFHFSFSLLWQTLTSLSTQPVLHIDHLLAWTNISGSQSVRWGYLFKKRWLRSGAALFVWMFVLTLQEQGREAFTDAEPRWWWWWWGGRGEDDAASCCIRALSTPSLSFVTSHAPSLSQLVGLQVANWPRLITAAHAERG